MSSTPKPPPPPLNERLQSLADQLRHFAANPDLSPPGEPAPLTPTSASADSSPAEHHPNPLRRIGDYELLDTIAVSGKTILYKARQLGLHRIVALRTLLRDAHPSLSEVQHFQAASESAAKLDHPGIVPIYEMGRHEGLPFYSVPYIAGGSLEDMIAFRGPLEPNEAVLLVRNIALALDYAHQHQILHYSLTPSKILLDDPQRVPNISATHLWKHSNLFPRITDFELAKYRLIAEVQTHSQQVLRSPKCTSSNRVTGQLGISDKSADVYSLWAILHYAITGRETFQETNYLELQHLVLGNKPSSRSQLSSYFPRRNECAAFQCEEKGHDRCLASANKVAMELDEFLERNPLPSPSIERLKRVTRLSRKPPILLCFVASAVVLVSLVIGYYCYSWSETVEFTQNELARLKSAEVVLYNSQLQQSHYEWQAENPNRVQEVLNACPSVLRNWEWDHLKQCTISETLACRCGHDAVCKVSYAPDGRRFAILGKGMPVRVWDVVSGNEMVSWNCDAPTTSVAWCPSGDDLLVGFLDGRISILDTMSGEHRSLFLIHQIAISDVVCHPEGDFVCVGSLDGSIRILQAFNGEPMSIVPTVGSPVLSIAIDPSGRWLATASVGGAIGVWEIESGQQVQCLSHPHSDARRIAFGPVGQRLISAGEDGVCRVWEVESGQVAMSFRRHDSSVGALQVSLDGEWAVSGSDDGVVCVWETDSGKLVRAWRAHDGPVSSVSIRPGGRELLTCATGEPLKVWRLDARAATRRSDSHSQRVYEVAFSPDGGRVASVSGDGSVRVWDAGTLERERALVGHQGEVLAVAFGPDGRWLVSTGEDGTIRRWDARSGRPLGAPAQGGTPLHSVAVSRRNVPVACGGADGSVSLWDVVAGRRLRSFPAHAGAVRGVRFSPDERLLASCGDDGAVRLWNVDSQTLWKSLGQHAGAAWHVAFSPDGDRLASAGDDGVAIVWELASGRQLFACAGHAGPVRSAAFSPDGSRLVTAGHDQKLKVWELDSGRELLTLSGHQGPVDSCLFSSDGRTVASAGADGRVRLWRADPWHAGGISKRPADRVPGAERRPNLPAE